MITTSVTRIKSAGYWCEDADTQTEKLLNILNAHVNTEIPIIEALEHLGLSTCLLALGAAHPRYATQAQAILSEYVRRLWEKLHSVYMPVDEHLDLLTLIGKHEQLRKRRTMQWRTRKYTIADPAISLACDAAIILLSDEPLHIRAIHAGKSLFSSLKYLQPYSVPHTEFEEFLREKLNGEDGSNPGPKAA